MKICVSSKFSGDASAGPRATPANLSPGIGIMMTLTVKEKPAEAGKFLLEVSQDLPCILSPRHLN